MRLFNKKFRLFDHLLCNIFHPKTTQTFLDDGHLSKYVTNYVASVQYIYTIPSWKANKTHNIITIFQIAPQKHPWPPLCSCVTAWVYPQNGAHPPENAPIHVRVFGFYFCSFWRPKPVIPPWALIWGLPVVGTQYTNLYM